MRNIYRILQGKDFFEFNEEADCICSNCPYSMIDKVLEKSIELNPDLLPYLPYRNGYLRYHSLDGWRAIWDVSQQLTNLFQRHYSPPR